MAIQTYDMAWQNGFVSRPYLYINETIYRKVLQDASSTSPNIIIRNGTIADIQAYLGSEFFQSPVNYPVGKEAGHESFLNAFPKKFAVNATAQSTTTAISTNGLFWCSYNDSNLDLQRSNASNTIYTPFSVRDGFGILGTLYYSFYGLVGNDFLDCIALCIEISYTSGSGYQLQVFRQYNGSWREYFNNRLSEVSAEALINYFENATPIPNNPYGPGGYSGEGGGNNGNFSEDSDEVEADPLPDETNFGATACGLITIFHPTKTQLKKLADVIWGKGFLNFLQNLVENISDLFISLGMLPFSVTHGNTVEVTWFSYDVGGDVPIGTGIYLDLAPNQWLEFQMGGIALDGTDPRIFSSDSVLDYSPYSKLGIYLPFIGYQELDIDECRDQTLYLTYRVDVLSGTCVALLTLNSYDEDRTIYEFTGNCLTQLPLTSMDAQSLITNAVNIGIAISSAGATEAVASAGDALAQSAFQASGGELGVDYDRMQHAFAANAAKVSNAQNSLLSSTVNGVMGMKPNFKKSGAVSASATLMAVKQPYLFLVTPRQSFPENYGHYCGYPSNIADSLGNFEGFTVVEDIRLNGLVATSPEVEEIYKLLKTGVII